MPRTTTSDTATTDPTPAGARTTRPARIVLVAGPDSRPSSPVVTVITWRMLAGNNRPVAGGVAAYASVAECRATVRRAQDAQPELAVTTYLAGGREAWRWRVSLHGEPVAVGVRAYARRFECARSADQFVALLPDAEIDERNTRRVDRAGLRRLLAHAPEPRSPR